MIGQDKATEVTKKQTCIKQKIMALLFKGQNYYLEGYSLSSLNATSVHLNYG
jgi:hypothetical protein